MSSDTALLVVDVQESFRHRPYFRSRDLPSFFDRLNALIEGAKRKGWALVRVFHLEPLAPFSESSGLVRPMKELQMTADVEVRKHAHSALAGSTLPTWLSSNGIRRVVVSGIRTEQCCETTARHASDSGWEVDFITEATLTFPMTLPRTGKSFSVEIIKEHTELVLHDRFARVSTVAELLAR